MPSREPRVIGARVIGAGLAVLAVMVMIFLFSAQDAEASHQVSAGLLARVLGWLGRALDYPEGSAELDALETALRKLGHFSEYALLGMALLVFLRVLGLRRPGWTAWGVSVLYACTDELHQLFSQGRSASPVDVGIDACGAAAGLLLLSAILRLISKKRRAREDAAC